MITIVYLGQYFPSFSRRRCYDFIRNTVGAPDKFSIRKEDEADINSIDVMLFTYNLMKIEGFEFFDELKVYAKENELGVNIYDHELKRRKGFWFDEKVDWVEWKEQELPDFMKD